MLIRLQVAAEAGRPIPDDVAGWWLDGVNQGAGIAALPVTMDQGHTAMAVYATPPHTLTVDATEPVTIAVDVDDINGDSNGTAPPAFTRTYHEGMSVTLTAPLASCVSAFRYWELDTVPQPLGVLTLTVPTDADLHDPALNTHLGTWYLRHLLDRFGDVESALAAYNAGPSNVERWGVGEGEPYAETTAFVRRVLSARLIYRFYDRFRWVVQITPSITF